MTCGYCDPYLAGNRIAPKSDRVLIDQVCEVDEPYAEMWLNQDFQNNKFWFEAKTVDGHGQESTVQTPVFQFCPWCGEPL